MLLSIIIPCYNVEKYLPCLLKPLWPCLNKEIELILIDDGSTDTTVAYIEKIVGTKKEKNIETILLGKNRGQSYARNMGIEKAQGEYILFFDSDDLIVPETLVRALTILVEKEPDILFMDLYPFQDKDEYCQLSSIQPCDILSKEKRTMLAEEIRYEPMEMLYCFFNDAMMYPPAVIFKRKCIENLYFPVGKKLEDVMTIPKYVSKGESYYYLSEPLVYYRRRSGSTMTTAKLSTFIDYSQAMSSVVDFFADIKISKRVEMQLFLCYITLMRWSLNDMIKLNLVDEYGWNQYVQSLNLFWNKCPYSKFTLILEAIKTYSLKRAMTTTLYLVSVKCYVVLIKQLKSMKKFIAEI